LAKLLIEAFSMCGCLGRRWYVCQLHRGSIVR